MKVKDLMAMFEKSPDVVMVEPGQTEFSFRDDGWDYDCLIMERPEYAERVVESVECGISGYHGGLIIRLAAA